MNNENDQIEGCIAWSLVVFVVLFIPVAIIVDVCGIWPIVGCGVIFLIGGCIFASLPNIIKGVAKMLEGRTVDELVGEVTVVYASPNECGIREDFDSEEIKIVGRKKAQQFVFEHLVAGCVCITKQVRLEGRTGTVMHLWSTKPQKEKE